MKEICFSLTQLEQVIIIMNTSFLILQHLTDFEIEHHAIFFMELTNLTMNHNISEFEKYSSLLINNLTFSEDFLEKLNNIHAIKGFTSINIK